MAIHSQLPQVEMRTGSSHAPPSVLDLTGDTGTGPHLDPAWIPASAGMTVVAELACLPLRPGLDGSQSLLIPSKVNSYPRWPVLGTR